MSNRPSKRSSSGSSGRSSRPGVRGPGGPPQQPPTTRATGPRAAAPASAGVPAGPGPDRSPARRRFEVASAPLLLAFHKAPRWLVVVGMAVLLFAGLVLPPSLGWLGAIMLAIVAAFLAWLLALSWPVLTGSSRWLRVFVVAALLGVAVLKALGRF